VAPAGAARALYTWTVALRTDAGPVPDDATLTVALRMPDHDLVREFLSETGPLAVSSANLTGKPAALTAAEALDHLGDRVSVYLDAGESSGSRVGSTIVDATPTRDGKPARILREGTISRKAIRDVLGVIAEGDE
jgi:tRNA A37 threonylcarbamoyladenosine synthetase subunit TsaC/SUA5/YrdC